MGTNEYSQPASKSSWDSQDFGDVNMVLKWPIFKSPPGHNELKLIFPVALALQFELVIFMCLHT